MTTTDLASRAFAVGLVSLDDPACEAPALAGNKAATLAVLHRAGFQVPPGVVVSADALSGADNELPPAVRAALSQVPGLLGRGPWAVRSSSTAEDSEHASFAGQFETVLNVELGGLADAVLRCWRSRLTDRVKVYRGERGPGSMSVLIQPMIDADAAGVAFTTDPVSGRDRTLIEAVEGLGERLVSGEATPERWTVQEDGSIEGPSVATVLDTEKARAIGDLAGRVEEHLERPQDIEWAIADGRLWLLQARPITTLPSTGPELLPIPIEVPPGDWRRDAFHEPIPLSPFGWVILSEQVVKVLPTVFAEFGILIERAEAASIGGWMYNRLIPVGAPSPGRRGGRAGPSSTPPRWLLRIVMRLHPAIRRRARAAREAIASDLPATVIRRWTDEWRPEHQEDIERALAVDLGSLSDQELAAQLDHRLEVVAHPAHAMVGFAWWIVVYELAEVCQELLGWDTARMLTLLEGLSTTSTAPARQLAHLAGLARSKPAIRELLVRVDETTPARLAEVDAEFARAFSGYVEANGHRAVRYDVIDPNLAEVPHLLLRLVADQLEVEFSPDQVAEEARRRRSQAADEARSRLGSHPEADRERFERALVRAAEAYPAWEDRVWWTQSVQTALLRYLALEIGHRLVARGLLATVDDVFFLEAQDARTGLFDGADRRETTRVGKGRRAWAMANPGPYMYGEPPSGDPPFDLLPRPARFVNQAVMWGIAQFFGSPGGQEEGVVTGTPASAGRYTGTVRVVMGEHQFDKIRAGDVVVCPTTSPVWSVVFPSMGALITDSGGILSHPAIIAREHGIPAVVDTGNATDILKDGQRVTVDG
ncbi:MAG TPA: PEP/pyruvate-binding domain-containing protein, partial [Acidimicrobiia bacterium]|nr:PEP/pyruvate-binding domain-containing protein [Acidimicrobiia bacterium]